MQFGSHMQSYLSLANKMNSVKPERSLKDNGNGLPDSVLL